MSEFLGDRINIAHNLIDEGQYEQAVEIMKNLKMRIHDQAKKDEMIVWEKQVEENFIKTKKEIPTMFGDIEEQFERYFVLKKQRATKYLEYYDKMIKEYDRIG